MLHANPAFSRLRANRPRLGGQGQQPQDDRDSMKSVCVYCGSNAGARPAYAERARAIGTRLAEERLTLVYGGGNVGLMGLVADATLAAGGDVIGVIPEQ